MPKFGVSLSQQAHDYLNSCVHHKYRRGAKAQYDGNRVLPASAFPIERRAKGMGVMLDHASTHWYIRDRITERRIRLAETTTRIYDTLLDISPDTFTDNRPTLHVPMEYRLTPYSQDQIPEHNYTQRNGVTTLLSPFSLLEFDQWETPGDPDTVITRSITMSPLTIEWLQAIAIYWRIPPRGYYSGQQSTTPTRRATQVLEVIGFKWLTHDYFKPAPKYPYHGYINSEYRPRHERVD